MESAPFVISPSRITTMWYQITENQKAWEERGETITQTTFRRHIPGAMKIKDQQEWMIEGPAARKESLSGLWLPEPRGNEKRREETQH